MRATDMSGSNPDRCSRTGETEEVLECHEANWHETDLALNDVVIGLQQLHPVMANLIDLKRRSTHPG
jgi:hypothetical protein